MYDSPNPHQFELPEEMQELSKFQFLLVMRTIRPDMLVPAVSDFVAFKIGDYFISPPLFDLALIFKDSGPSIPLIFVLSPGADPLNGLQTYADTKKK
jgi:dynein heavy chain, axonemal